MDDEEFSAYFMLCQSDLPYGWIVCVDGTLSKRFASIAAGQKVLAELLAEDRIGEQAALEFAEGIAECGLKGEDTELDEFLEELQAKSDNDKPRSKMSDELRSLILKAMERPKTFRKRKTLN